MRAKVLDLVAKKLFLTKGMGVHEDKLTSFEYALRNAGIAGTNLVLISSIFPPGAKLISYRWLEINNAKTWTTLRMQNMFGLDKVAYSEDVSISFTCTR